MAHICDNGAATTPNVEKNIDDIIGLVCTTYEADDNPRTPSCHLHPTLVPSLYAIYIFFVDLHIVNDDAVMGKVDVFPRAVVYEACIAACHWGAWALFKAARYALGSTHYRAERRATAVKVAPAGVWDGPVIGSGTWGCSKISSFALPWSGSQHAVTSVGG
jgi:hypothetical protein